MNVFLFLIISAAFVYIECMIGGTRFLFSYPAYFLLGVAAFFSVFSLRRPLSKPSTPILCTTLLLAGYVFVRAWSSPYPYLARTDLMMTAGCLLIYLLSALYLTTTRIRMAFIWVLVGLALLQVGLGIAQFVRQDGIMLFGFEKETINWRATGTLISGNHYAGYLETVAMFTLAIACWSRYKLPLKLFFGLVTLLCYVGVAISGSRGGYLSSAFALVVFATLSIRTLCINRPGKALIPSLSILGVLLVLFGSIAWVGSHNEIIRKRAEQIKQPDIRIYNWQATIDHFKLAPWLGTGAGTHLIYGRLFRKPPLQTDPVHAHSDYLEMLAEYGIVGEALALLFLAAHFSGGLRAGAQLSRRYAPPGSDTLALNFGAMGAVAALAAHSVVDFNMHIPGNALLLAFIFGMLANPGRAPLPGPIFWGDPAMLLRLALPALGIATCAATLPRYHAERLTEQARVALRDGKNPQSIKLSKQAILEEQDNAELWLHLGEANRMIGLRMPVPNLRAQYLQQALSAYRNGLRVLPQDIHLLVRQAQALDGLGRYDDAEHSYRTAIQWDPNLGILYHYLASHYHLRGDQKAEQETLHKANQYSNSSDDTGRAAVETLKKWDGKKTIE